MSASAKPPMSRLETCPPEVLCLITEHCTGGDVMSLFLCGCSNLSLRLFNEGVSVLRFDWSHARYRIWYPFVQKFRNLRTLSITASFGRFFSRFELSPHFVTLEALILVLTLNAEDSKKNPMHCLNQREALGDKPLNLAIATPGLKRLELRNFAVSIPFVRLLPETLEHLDIFYALVSPITRANANAIGPMEVESDEFAFFSHIVPRHLEALPRNLRHLQLRNDMTCSVENVSALPPLLETAILQTNFSDDSLALFPKSLTFSGGSCTNLSSASMASLPAAIQRVNFTTPASASGNEQSLSLLTSQLSEKVTHLTVSGAILADYLPSKLTHLAVGNGSAILSTHFSSLPRTLVSLSINRCSHRLVAEITVPHLPPGLKTLVLDRIEPFGEDWVFSGLPSGLTSLDLTPHYTWTSNVIAALPRTLTDLNISRMRKLDNLGIQTLPPCIQMLTCIGTRITGEAFISLPRGLRRFTTDAGSTVRDFQISHLPRSLRYLRLSGGAQLTNECFKLLPRRLTSLILDGTNFSCQKIADLPKSLTVLNMDAAGLIRNAYFSQELVMLDTDEREEEECPIFVQSAAISSPSSSSFLAESASFFSDLFKKITH